MDSIRLARWSTALAIIVATAALLIGLMLVVLSQIPSVRKKVRCKSNMIATGGALQRYYWPNEGYPDNLEALRSEYLKDPRVLRCPLDNSPGDKPSYKYLKPTPDAPDDVIVLVCDRHRGSHSNQVLFQVTKGGEFKVEPFEAPASRMPAKK